MRVKLTEAAYIELTLGLLVCIKKIKNKKKTLRHIKSSLSPGPGVDHSHHITPVLASGVCSPVILADITR